MFNSGLYISSRTGVKRRAMDEQGLAVPVECGPDDVAIEPGDELDLPQPSGARRSILVPAPLEGAGVPGVTAGRARIPLSPGPRGRRHNHELAPCGGTAREIDAPTRI